MTPSKASLLEAVLLMQVLSPQGHAALAQPDWSFRDLEAASRQLSNLRDLSTVERMYVALVKTSVDALHARYRSTFHSAGDKREEIRQKLPAPFRDSVADDLAVLQMLKQPGESRVTALADVSGDLALKVKFAESAFGLGGGFPALVKVTVETVRAGKKQDGLWVRANPRRYGVNSDPMFLFNSASSPTTTNLPPGLFVLWVETPEHQFLASQPVEIGAGGTDSETIRFSLP